MKWFVAGEEIDLAADPEVAVSREGDRLAVRTARGVETALCVRQGDRILVSFRGRQFVAESGSARRRVKVVAHSGEIHATMPGLITSVIVSPGDAVRQGDKLAVLEAMKTQQAFLAPFDGEVAQVLVASGDQVVESQLLVVISPVAPTV